MLETLLLKSVVIISQKVMNRSSSNSAHFFYIIFSTAWTKDFFFSILSNFSRPYSVQILLKNGTFGSQLRQKCKFWFIFFLRSSTSYEHLRIENFWFFNFRWICHELSWLRRKNFFLRVTGDEVPITEFSKFFNKNFTKYLSNMYLLYGKLFE